MRGRLGALSLFGLSSLAAVLLGCFILAQAGVSAGSWGRNAGAWLAGALLALSMRFLPRANWVPILLLGAALLGLAAVFLNEDQLGVHRWLDAGPLHINAAALLLPVGLVALGRIANAEVWPLGAAILVIALLVLQPDASHATAFALGASIIVAATRHKLSLRAGTIILLLALAAFSWTRHDPLVPVPEVEGILMLGWQITPLLAIGAAVALAVAALSPAIKFAATDDPSRTIAMALTAYMIVAALSPAIGAFPVPLVGIGMSPILGFWLGIGYLCSTDDGATREPD